MEKKKITVQMVRDRLGEMSDPEYREFHASLLPGIHNIMGIRVPKLRELAREISKNDWQEWFMAAEDSVYEEAMVRGLTAAYARMDWKERFCYIREFVPAIDNWAVCDSFCNTLKEAKKHQSQYWEFLEPYVSSDREYEARFAAVMILSHFVNEEYLEEGLKRLESIRQEGYYAKMAVAWAVSVYFTAFPERVLDYLQNSHNLDEFTYQKALQKIVESYRVDKDTKNIIREMRQRG